jgi:hypothetical protein
MSDFMERDFECEIILWAMRRYCRYGIGCHDLEQQMMGERGVPDDHYTIYRWVQKYTRKIEKWLRCQWSGTSPIAPTPVALCYMTSSRTCGTRTFSMCSKSPGA